MNAPKIGYRQPPQRAAITMQENRIAPEPNSSKQGGPGYKPPSKHFLPVFASGLKRNLRVMADRHRQAAYVEPAF